MPSLIHLAAGFLSLTHSSDNVTLKFVQISGHVVLTHVTWQHQLEYLFSFYLPNLLKEQLIGKYKVSFKTNRYLVLYSNVKYESGLFVPCEKRPVVFRPIAGRLRKSIIYKKHYHRLCCIILGKKWVRKITKTYSCFSIIVTNFNVGITVH